MAGYREFQTGEVLTAANVNDFLAKQAVMVFDDAAARTAALAGVLREGMLTYNKDTGRLEIYDGSDFVVAAPPQNLVAVKHVLKTDPWTASVSAGGNAAVDDLSITHEVADAANRLIITASLGVVAVFTSSVSAPGLAVHDGTDLIAIGDASGSRTRLSAASQVDVNSFFRTTRDMSFTFVHTPGSGSKTYTLRVVNLHTDSRTFYVNRNEDNSNTATTPLGASSLIIQEVKV